MLGPSEVCCLLVSASIGGIRRQSSEYLIFQDVAKV